MTAHSTGMANRLRATASRMLGRFYLPLAHGYRSFQYRAHLGALSARPDRFDDRKRGRRVLLIILAGHKHEMWPLTLERAVRHTSSELADICMVCSGGAPHGDAARALAARNGWSFLQAREDLLAHAQNLAVQQFPDAEWIAKIDEDMFVTPGWLETVLHTAESVQRDSHYRIGIVAPVTPLNGYGYRVFLDLTGSLDAYVAAFPDHPPISAALGVGAQSSPEVAEWIWRRTHPLDVRAAELAAHAGEYSVCPHRFSIGAFAMLRATYEEMGGFAVAPVAGLLGYEEAMLCSWCMTESRVIIVAHGALVAHFAFGPQWVGMQALLKDEPALFH